jgi:nitroreductase
MANSLGIGSCWINQLRTICDKTEVRALLSGFEIPENHIVWGIAALGYAATESKGHSRNENVIKFIK